MTPDLRTLEEAADDLGVPLRSLRTAAEEHGFLVQMGRAIRIDRNDYGRLVKKMPRPSKGARLHKFAHRPHWYIRDTGQPDRSTGHTSRPEAEKALAAYIATKGRTGSANEPANVTCGEVLAIYAEEYAPTVAAPERIGYALDALLSFWSPFKLSHVRGETCRRYTKFRNRSAGTTRRELGVLQAAINYAHREGYVTSAPIVTLPEKPVARERWLTREEAAKLLWAAYRGHKAKHLCQFILIALYTGTRKDAILRMGFEPNTVGGWFDLENKIVTTQLPDLQCDCATI